MRKTVKYPIDRQTINTMQAHIIAHERAQNDMILALSVCLAAAMDEMGMEDTEWYPEAQKLLKLRENLKNYHDNRIFNEKNGHAEHVVISPETVNANYADIVPSLGIGQINDPEENKRLNDAEKTFGEEMSAEEVARIFKESTSKGSTGKVDMSKKDPFKGMTLEEIEEWEAKQNNSNDLYKIKARVQNSAVASSGNLTPVGEMMVNSFVHVLKDLYDYADSLSDKSEKITLIERVRKHENMPGQLIAATKTMGKR